MDEILASIRKIIADDPMAPPTGLRDGPAAASTARGVNGRVEPKLAAPVAPGERRSAADIDRDIADLLDVAPAPTSDPLPAPAIAAEPRLPKPGWFGLPNGAAKPTEPARPAPLTAKLEQARLDAAKPAAPLPRPAAPAPAAAAAPAPAPVPAPAPIAEAPKTAAASAPKAPAAVPPNSPALSALADLVENKPAKPVPAAAPPVERPVAEAVPVPAPPVPEVMPVPPPAAETGPIAAVEPIAAAAPAPVPVPAAEVKPAAASSVLSAEALVAALPASRPAAAGADATVRSVEDLIADLLRPMLRQWLDENMPRIVEKALRVELAQGVKLPTLPVAVAVPDKPIDKA